MKRNSIYLLIMLLVMSACSNDDDALLAPIEEGVDMSYNEVLNFKKDKAKYNPGEEVSFSVNGTHQNTTVRYKYLGQVIAEEPLTGTSWTWEPPSEDFRGYMVELVKETDGEETIIGTVAVDVSSDWTKFPRYGFLSKFGNTSASQRAGILNNLKDYHINGLQYYDWHFEHHRPLPLDENGEPAETWNDLFNREIYFSTVEGYIEQAQERNMASMFYNLLFGVWKNDNEQPVPLQWLMFEDRNHRDINRHILSGFGDIQLADPSNEDWQEHIFGETATVYENLDFDGWHLDQLGDRGNLYNYEGYRIDLGDAYKNFLTSLENRFPGKKLVLNAVDQYEQQEILESPVDFAYSEIWSRYQYQDLARVILENYEYSNGELNTVLAAYMNYNSQSGNFNTPSVLMTDAVIFAFGGAHLELGEHMLSSEYFPNDKLAMSVELRNSVKEYYDFHTAYQNLLRDGGSFNFPSIQSQDSDVKLNNWPPVVGQAAVVGKQLENGQVLHLLNYDGVSTLQWRDDSKVQTTPLVKDNFSITVDAGRNVSKVWFASPDVDGGASQELEFSQSGNQITLEVPYLKYWSMLVLEY